MEKSINQLIKCAERFLREAGPLQEYMANSEPTAEGLSGNGEDVISELRQGFEAALCSIRG